MQEIEVCINSSWVSWHHEDLSVGDRFRNVDGPNAGVVMRVLGDMVYNEYGVPFIPVAVELH